MAPSRKKTGFAVDEQKKREYIDEYKGKSFGMKENAEWIIRKKNERGETKQQSVVDDK
jgi:hypothetical protein